QRVAFPMTDRIAIPLPDARGEMRATIRGNDADIVDFLGFNGHVSATLDDLQIAVVTGGKQRRSHSCAGDPTRLQRPIFYAVEFMALFFGRYIGESLSCLGGQLRNRSFRSHN